MPRSTGSILLADSGRLLTSPWQRPRATALAIDWTRAPRGLNTFAMFEGNLLIDVVQGRQFTIKTSVADGSTAIGTGFNYTQVDSGTTQTFYTPVAPLFTSGSQPSSFEAYFYWTQNTGAVIGLHEATPDGTTADRMVGVNNSNQAFFYIFDGAGNTSVGATLSAGLQHLVGVADGSTNKIYVNGALSNSQSAANSGFVTYTTPVFSVGSQANSAGFGINISAIILHGAFATVAWTADEVMDRYLNMYSFLVPVENDLPVMLPPPPPPPPLSILGLAACEW